MLSTEGALKEPILVVGGDSTLGQGLVKHWSERGQPVVPTTRRTGGSLRVIHCDLAKGDWSFGRYHAAVLCAGITGQDSCRQHPAESRHINVVRTLELARHLMDSGCFVVFISTNLVFDGTRPLRQVDEPPCPQTEYGRQKAEVEAALLESRTPAAVMRLSKVIQRDTPLFLSWINDLRARRPVRAFSNYRCSPIPADLAVAAIAQLAERRAGGIWHLSAADDISYAQIAQQFAGRLRRDPGLVETVAADASVLEHLPQYTSLDSTKTGVLLRGPLPDSRLALDQVFFSHTCANYSPEP